ncbi:response regulator, partial [bacterium]|nr:response regulator [bacterium]
INDTDYVRQGFCDYLEDRNYAVLQAENGRVGVEIFEREKPDLVLVDLHMPEMDGFEVLARITSVSPDTPIIIVSGADDVKEVVKALKLGAWDYLMKPIEDLSILAHTIKKSLERRDLIRENREYQARLEGTIVEQTKELERTYQDLQESEKQYRTIVETAKEGIWTINPKGRTTFVTRQTAEMFGYSVEEMLNSEISQFLDNENRMIFEEKNRDLWKGKGGRYDLKFQRRDKSELWGIVSTNPIFDSENSVTACFVMLMDITDRKQAEEELARHRDHLEELVAERTSELEKTHKALVEKAHKAGMADISIGIVHNLGNILNSVKTSAQVMDVVISESLVGNLTKANDLLRENMESLEEFILHSEKGKKLLQYYLLIEEGLVAEQKKIKEMIDRLMHMIDAIVDVVSMHLNYVDADLLMEECSLQKIVEDALVMQADTLKNMGVIVKRDYNHIPLVVIHKTKFLQILIDIIDNAADAMSEIPEIDRCIKIKIDHDKNDPKAVIISLGDNGSGIELENLNQVFAQGYTTKEKKYGLGLHNCANFMAEMGGKIWIEKNENGKGITLFLKLQQ